MDTLIKLSGFGKSFSDKVVHKNLDFELRPGEVVGLIGGSGSGKSVLCRAMIGLEKADEGKIFFKDKEVTHCSEEEWIDIRLRIAYVFQSGALFDSLTVEENLLYPLDAHRAKMSRSEKQKKIDEALELFGLKGANQLLPASLSGGMQKRAGLARSLMLDPEVILYDEPTAGLDPFNTKNIQEIILDLKKGGHAGILVTHDMPTAMATCDRLCLLMDGKIAVSGSTQSLVEDRLIKAFMTGEMAYGTSESQR